MANSSVTADSKSTGGDGSQKENPFHVEISVSFLLGTLMFVAGLAFAVGHLSRDTYLKMHAMTNGAVVFSDGGGQPGVLPPPFYSVEKDVPHTIYSSKHYDTGGPATTDTLFARRVKQEVGWEEVALKEDEEIDDEKADDDEDEEENQTKELHEPSGQHLLIDMKSVNGVFLNSEEQLARAMIDLVNLSGLTLLSYHCHGLQPVGVSCAGVLLESHISFHTWPIQGVISLDLFTCGSMPLLPLLPDIERLFGVPRTPAVKGQTIEKPHLQWAHKRRGFTSAIHNPEDVDMQQFMLGWIEFDLKEHLISEETDFQTVDVYEVINPRFHTLDSYEKSLSNDGSYESMHPEFFRPDRIIYLDGVMQSRLYGEAAYHEALVHPAMISHNNPKRVAIIGGGEGATLREVLKHNTVETVIMIEIDEDMVDVSREYIPEWSDCSMIAGSTPSCFDDPRAEVYYEDAIKWFIDRYSNKNEIDESTLFDVIIMDALDPSSIVAFSDVLYNNDHLVRAFSNALTESGVFVVQIGEEDFVDDPGPAYTNSKTVHSFVNGLHESGFESTQSYGEAHGNFLAPWSFMIFFQNIKTRYALSLNEAEINLRLKQRSMEPANKDMDTLFRFFDGATMMNYQNPSRAVEDVFCRNIPRPRECDNGHGFDPEKLHVPISNFEVTTSKIPNVGVGLVSREDIPEGSLIALDDSFFRMIIYPTTIMLLEKFGSFENGWNIFDQFLFKYGYETKYFGKSSYSIDPGIISYTNHGCNETYNIISSEFDAPFVNEKMANPIQIPNDKLSNNNKSPYESAYFSPYVRRNVFNFIHDGYSNKHNIKAGEEILNNYLLFYGEKHWERGVRELQTNCGESNNSEGMVETK